MNIRQIKERAIKALGGFTEAEMADDAEYHYQLGKAHGRAETKARAAGLVDGMHFPGDNGQVIFLSKLVQARL